VGIWSRRENEIEKKAQHGDPEKLHTFVRKSIQIWSKSSGNREKTRIMTGNLLGIRDFRHLVREKTGGNEGKSTEGNSGIIIRGLLARVFAPTKGKLRKRWGAVEGKIR